LYSAVAQRIKAETHTSVDFITDMRNTARLDSVMDRYLRSNGIEKLSAIGRKSPLLNLMIGKFFMLSTTCFFREWPELEQFKAYLPALVKQARAQQRPLRLKVFACSTGEEVISYAIELFEAGIEDFTILASDINESSLHYAGNMLYSPAAVNMLSSHRLRILQKYFLFHPDLGAWKPREPERFSRRIKFMAQDLLKPLPERIDPGWAPPYDLISIMNVLLYLDNKEIDAQKSYWLKLLVDNGIFILHDKSHSIMRGSFTATWAFSNFLLINEYVNVKAGPAVTGEEKVRQYEQRYRENSKSEKALKVLCEAYANTGHRAKAYELARGHIQLNPQSAIGLGLSLLYADPLRDREAIRTLCPRIARVSLPEANMLPVFAAAEPDSADQRYLQALYTVSKTASSAMKQNPFAALAAFDTKTSTSVQWEPLRLGLKLNLAAGAMKYLGTEQRDADMQKLMDVALPCSESLLVIAPDFYIAAEPIQTIFETYHDYFIKKDSVAAINRQCDRTLQIVRPWTGSSDFFSINYLLGTLYLREGSLHEDLLDTTAEAKAYIDTALAYLHKVLDASDDQYIATTGIGYSLYRKLGSAYLLSARYSLRRGDTAAARDALSRALKFLDSGIDQNPVYSQDLHAIRDEAEKLAQEYHLETPAD
jgi:chemotaxis methyl-accepting protein methylase